MCSKSMQIRVTVSLNSDVCFWRKKSRRGWGGGDNFRSKKLHCTFFILKRYILVVFFGKKCPKNFIANLRIFTNFCGKKRNNNNVVEISRNNKNVDSIEMNGGRTQIQNVFCVKKSKEG